MPNYFAIIRLKRNDAPLKMSFQAHGTSKAILEMLKGAGCSSISEVKEYEILEILENNKYVPVAARYPPGSESLGRNWAPTTESAPPKESVTPPPVPSAEPSYQSYSVKEA